MVAAGLKSASLGGRATVAVARPMLGLFARRPLDCLAGVVVAGLSLQVGVNALFLQEGRHPAPFFEAAPVPRPNLRAKPMPKPVTEERTGSLSAFAALANEPPPERVRAVQAALAATGRYDGPVDGTLGKQTTAAILAYELEAGLPPTGEPSEALLERLGPVPVTAAPARTVPVPRAKAPPPPPPPPLAPAAALPEAAASTASPRVLAVQKALSKLGYGPVRLDGVPGAATKQAVARFEADRRLPVTGELSPRVLQEIASVSGMQVN